VDVYVDVPRQGVRRIRRRSPLQTKKGTEAYERELIEAASPEGLLVDLSAKLGLDLSRLDLDAPLDDLHAPGVQGIIEQLSGRLPNCASVSFVHAAS